MSHHTHIRIINKLVITGFFLEWLLGLVGAILPSASFGQIFCWELGAMSLIAGSTLMAVKLARQNWDIPSAGYTSLAIAQGVFYSVLSNERSLTDDVDNFAMASGVILLLPSMLLICYYKVYPVWLRILGVIVCIPFLLMLYEVYKKNQVSLYSLLNGISFGLLQLTSLCWAIIILISMRKEKKAMQNQH